MTQSHPRTQWVLNSAIDQLGLEHFATSIAALAQGNISPIAVLEQVLGTIVENLNSLEGTPTTYSIDRLMLEKANAYGFSTVAEFHQCLVRLISDRMIDLEFSRLSADQRRQRLQG